MQRSKLKKFVLDGLLGVLFGILLWPVIKYYSLSNLPTVLYPLVLPYGLGFMAAIGLGMRGAPAPWTEAAPVLLAVCSLFFCFLFFSWRARGKRLPKL